MTGRGGTPHDHLLLDEHCTLRHPEKGGKTPLPDRSPATRFKPPSPGQIRCFPDVKTQFPRRKNIKKVFN
jgi:hypothetical protein